MKKYIASVIALFAFSTAAQAVNIAITPKVVDSFNTKLAGKMYKVEVAEITLSGCSKPVQVLSAPGFPIKAVPAYEPPANFAKDQWPTAVKQGLECDIRRFMAQLAIWYPGKDGQAKGTLANNPFASGSYFILANPIMNTDKDKYETLTEPCWGGMLVGDRQTGEPIDAYVYGREIGITSTRNLQDAFIRAQGRLAWKVQNDQDCQKRMQKIGVLFAPTQWNPTVTTVNGTNGTNGTNGRGITSIKLVGTQFIATYTDGTTEVVGEIQTPESARDGRDGTNGTNGTNGQNGTNGISLDRIVIENGNFVSYFTDGTKKVVGPVPQPAQVTVVDIAVRAPSVAAVVQQLSCFKGADQQGIAEGGQVLAISYKGKSVGVLVNYFHPVEKQQRFCLRYEADQPHRSFNFDPEAGIFNIKSAAMDKVCDFGNVFGRSQSWGINIWTILAKKSGDCEITVIK